MTILAQLVNEYPLLYTYGPMGIFAAYFMLKIDPRLASIEHKMVGLNRTMLIELLSRESISVAAKAAAREELEKLNTPRK